MFCAGVEHAHRTPEDMTQLGVRAVAIDGKTQNRESLLKAFQKGEIDVITNYGVLTEGFDDPTVECILMARPTTSPLVYNQCIGRGLRIAPRKSTCIIIDIIDIISLHIDITDILSILSLYTLILSTYYRHMQLEYRYNT